MSCLIASRKWVFLISRKLFYKKWWWQILLDSGFVNMKHQLHNSHRSEKTLQHCAERSNCRLFWTGTWYFCSDSIILALVTTPHLAVVHSGKMDSCVPWRKKINLEKSNSSYSSQVYLDDLHILTTISSHEHGSSVSGLHHMQTIHMKYIQTWSWCSIGIFYWKKYFRKSI